MYSFSSSAVDGIGVADARQGVAADFLLLFALVCCGAASIHAKASNITPKMATLPSLRLDAYGASY